MKQIRCSTCSVILNVTATQYTCSLNSTYCPTDWYSAVVIVHTCAHYSPSSLAARLHQCHRHHSCYINNGWTFYGQTIYTHMHIYVHVCIYISCNFFIFNLAEFIANWIWKTIQVYITQIDKTSSAHCIVHPFPPAKSLSTPVSPLLPTSTYLALLPPFHHHTVFCVYVLSRYGFRLLPSPSFM